MLETWSVQDVLLNRRGVLSPAQAERARRDDTAPAALIAADVEAGAVRRLEGRVDDDGWARVDLDGETLLDPRLEGVLPGRYWLYVLPASKLVVGFEALVEAGLEIPLRETADQLRQYRQRVLAANQLSSAEVEGLARHELPAHALLSIQADLRERRLLLVGLTLLLLFMIGLVTAMAASVGSDWRSLGQILLLGCFAPLAPFIAVAGVRLRRLFAAVRRPTHVWLEGPLAKRHGSIKGHPYYELSVPGSPQLRVARELYRACRQGHRHKLVWLHGTHYFVAVF